MRKTPQSVSDRLALVVGWLNDEPTEDEPVARRGVFKKLATFVGSFDGSPSAGYVEVPSQAPRHRRESIPRWLRKELATGREAVDIDQLQANLGVILDQGFDPAKNVGGMMTLASLCFAVRGSGRVQRKKGRTARRIYTAAGAYVLQVSGSLHDLVIFLTSHLLTQPGAAIGRCPAPAPYDRSDTRCGKFVVTSGQGRPRVFCSDACRIRNHAEEVQRQQDELKKKRKTR